MSIPPFLAPILQLISGFTLPLVVLLILLTSGFLVVSLMPPRFINPRAGKGRKKSKKSQAEEDVKRAEFTTLIGGTPEKYRKKTLLVAAVGAIIAYLLTGSYGLGITIFVVYWYFRRSRASARLERYRNNLLTNEVIPTAQSISAAVGAGMSVAAAVSDAARVRGGTQETGLQLALRRALSDPRGLEEGLRSEEARAYQDTLREFYEILSDGAAGARQTATTGETLDKFCDLSLRRRSAFVAAMLVTGQSRGTRLILSFLVPGVFTVGLAMGGADKMLHSMEGNLIILALLGLITVAYIITNLTINSVTKGF